MSTDKPIDPIEVLREAVHYAREHFVPMIVSAITALEAERATRKRAAEELLG